MRIRILIIALVFPFLANAQLGGKRAFEFVHLPSNSLLTALGGVNVSLNAENGLMSFNNPALTDSLEAGDLAISWLNYFADINLSTGSYVLGTPGGRKITLGAVFMDYGSFQGFDDTGIQQGKFNAKEYYIIAGTSHQLNAFNLGVNLKFAHSLLESHSASALLMDIGGTFKPGPEGLLFGMTFKNIGFVLSDYSDLAESSIPVDVQVGTTFKPTYMPFRFSITAYNLVRSDAVYFDESLNVNESEPGFGEEIFRRLNFGAELLLSKAFQVQFGYNYLTRKELRLQQTGGGAGFSFGLSLHLKRFELAYAHSQFHAAGGTNQLTLATNIKQFGRKDNL